MNENPTPTLVLQQAWSVLRLVKLQELVNTTIAQLERVDPFALLGRELSNQERTFSNSPMEQALAACIEELRCESGIRSVTASPPVRSAVAEPAWSAAYDEALGRYRRMATQLLRASLDAKPKQHE